MKRATTLAEIPQALKPKPLTAEELEEFFIETTDARDPASSRREEIAQCLERRDPEEEDSVKILLAGHAGSGKSTELVKLQQEHADQFAFARFSLIKEAQIGHASIDTILILTVEAIARALKEVGCPVKKETLQGVYDWFTEVFEIEERDLERTGALGGQVGAEDSLLGKILGLGAYLKADIKTGAKTLHKTINKENKRLSELAFQTNLLIKEARLGVREQLGKDLLLIMEDLDKCTIQEADAFFIENPAPLADLPCKVVLTAPVFLLCNPRASQLRSFFEIITLPMIKLVEPDGSKVDAGWKALREILDERLALDDLVDEDAIELAIEKTGGVLRHLFETLELANNVARQAVRRGRREEERIIQADVRYGLNRLKSELLRQIGVMGLPEEFAGVTTEQLYGRLRELHERQKPGRVASDQINLLLLQAHALIEYNGEGWHQVHPLIAEHLRD